MQKWKSDPKLYDCERKDGKKVLDYHTTYVDEFLNSDRLCDWESFERCKNLWYWAAKKSEWGNIDEWKVLDAGTKDCQFPEFLKPLVDEAIGIEISPDYIKYALEKSRPIIYMDVCNMKEEWSDKFDCVFSHHVLGLVSDIQKALEEIYRVAKNRGHIVLLTQIPGNEKKHYSYLSSPDIFYKFVREHGCRVIYNDYLDTGFENEWVFICQVTKLREDKNV